MSATLVERRRGPRARAITSSLVLVLALAPVLLSAGPARAQVVEPEAKGVALTEPAVVYVGNSIDVCIRVRNVSGVKECYRQDFAGTGFAVNRGVIVTASHVVEPSADDKVKLQNYAVNRFFTDLGWLQLGRNDDPYRQYQALPIPDFEGFPEWLDTCYAGDQCEFSIKSSVSVYPPVQVGGVTTPKPLRAAILKKGDYKETDVAVLEVDAKAMPTVALAPSIASLDTGQRVIAIGFAGSAQRLPTGTTEPAKRFGYVSNVREGAVGTGKQIEVDINISHGQSGGPVLDQSGKVVGLVSYALLGDDGTADQQYLRTVDSIRAGLKAAGVEAGRGEIDAVFEQAMNLYWDRHYSAALPLYQKVLNLYDGHPLAKQYLAKAQAEAGGPNDVPLPAPARDDSGPSMLLLVTLGGAALIVVAVVVVVMIARHRRAAASGEDAEPDGPGFEVLHTPMPAAGPPPQALQSDDLQHAAAPRAVATAVVAPEQRLEARFCGNCGNKLSPGNRFCSSCGQPVG